MSKFTLRIETGNAAFGESDAEMRDEIARILRSAIRAIEDGRSFGRLIDANGNTVGAYHLED